MVAFARAKAKSIFSRLRLPAISKTQMKADIDKKHTEISTKLDKNSNFFLEAIKSGGIWLS